MSTFYDIDSTRVSFKEYWWWHKSPLVLISLLNKVSKVRTPCSSDDPNAVSTLPFVVAQLPAEKLKANPEFDPQLVELHTQLTQLSYTNRTERLKVLAAIGEKLGVEKTEDGSSSRPFGYSGFISRHGLLFQLNWISMDDPATGLPAMTDWLCERHCLGVRYEFMGSFGGDIDDSGDEE